MKLPGSARGEQSRLRVARGCCHRGPLAPPPSGMLDGDDPREAVDGFKQVVEMEQEKGEWWVDGLADGWVYHSSSPATPTPRGISAA